MSAWDDAKLTPVIRTDTLTGEPVELDRGVNFFVLALERAGAKTLFSCQGHPHGFYISFIAPYALALQISETGYFAVEIGRSRIASARRRWALRLSPPDWPRRRISDLYTQDEHDETLHDAAEAWAAAAWFIA